MRGALALLLVLAAANAHAQLTPGGNRARLASTIVPNGGVLPEYSSGSVTFKDGTGTTRIGHNWDAPPNARATRLNENYRVQVGGNTIDWTRRSIVPALSIGTAAAAAARALPAVAVGVALWDLWDAVRVSPDGQGGLVSDAGVPLPAGSNQTRYRICSGSGYSTAIQACTSPTSGSPNVGGPWASLSEACEGYRAWLNGQHVNGATLSSCSSSIARVGIGGIFVNGNIETIQVYVPGECPASIDPYNSAYSIPAGAPAMPDGKCPTARGLWAPVSNGDAASRLESFDPPAVAELPAIAEDALSRGQSIPGVQGATGVGPSSVPGTPTTTTTTNPDGSTTTVTKTPTTNYTYNGDTVNYTTTIVTVTNNGGSTTTTVEGTTPEESDQCKLYPDSLACAKLGDPSGADPVATVRSVPWEVEDLGLGAGCPAPVTWEVFGLTLTWGYQPVCDVAPLIRLALLAFASIGAIGIVIKETNA